jgi:hypothetical protein
VCSPAVSSLVCRSCDYTLQASCSGVSLPGVKFVTVLAYLFNSIYIYCKKCKEMLSQTRRTPHCGNYGLLLGLNRLYSVSVSQPSYLTVSLSPAPIALPTPRDHRISALPPVLVVPNVDSYPIRMAAYPIRPFNTIRADPSVLPRLLAQMVGRVLNVINISMVYYIWILRYPI